MRDDSERWIELARLASTEQDGEKLVALVDEINCLLEKKQARLKKERAISDSLPNPKV